MWSSVVIRCCLTLASLMVNIFVPSLMVLILELSLMVQIGAFSLMAQILVLSTMLLHKHLISQFV